MRCFAGEGQDTVGHHGIHCVQQSKLCFETSPGQVRIVNDVRVPLDHGLHAGNERGFTANPFQPLVGNGAGDLQHAVLDPNAGLFRNCGESLLRNAGSHARGFEREEITQ